MICYRVGPSVRNCRKVSHTTRFLAERRVDEFAHKEDQ